MVETLADIALEFNASYSEAKRKNIKGNIFLGILKSLFVIYGNYFGYDDSPQGLSAFKGDLEVARTVLATGERVC